MTPNRILTWDGCNNVRDLGGLNASNGYKTRWGAVVRSDHPAKLTADGWSALYEHGIRTIISLRTYGLDEKDHPVVIPLYSDINVVSVDIEDITDEEFVVQWFDSGLWGTPLYYRDALLRWQGRHTAALKAIAQAKPGGVLFHCKRGHDRTGIIALLLLALAGVPLKDIVTDYELSVDPVRDQLLVERDTNVHEVLLNTLEGINVENYLLEGGLSQNDLNAVRTRFIEPINKIIDTP